MAEPVLRVKRSNIAEGVEFGDDVYIEADELEIAANARLGSSGSDDFRTPGGIRIEARRVFIGTAVEIGRAVRIEGGTIRLDDGVKIRRHSTIRVLDELHIGAAGTVGERCEISGRQVRFGHELWMLPGAKIGGGSAFETDSRLDAGHYCHLGVDALINTARPVEIGHEVGLGTRTSIYTHGAYPSRLQGFPVAFDGVTIGDFTWIPGAVINPGVRIGRNCVIGVNSLVTKDIADGSLAAGSPATVIKENAYPRPLSGEIRLEFFETFLRRYASLLGENTMPLRLGSNEVRLVTTDATYAMLGERDLLPEVSGSRVIAVGADCLEQSIPEEWTVFDTNARLIEGIADALSDRFANELRRYGIRFYSRPIDNRYVRWIDAPPRFESGPSVPTSE